VLGNYNRIYPNTRIYPNVTMGDRNICLENNVIGEHPICSMKPFIEKEYNGVTIGHHNYFHTDNKIFGGTREKTKIGNYTKLLHNVHIGHDSIVNDHVHIYPNTILAGYCKLLPHSGVGQQSALHQHSVIGSYSFIGMMSAITKPTFPFYIYIGNKQSRLNTKRCPEGIEIYSESLQTLSKTYTTITKQQLIEYLQIYPETIQDPLRDFFKHIHMLHE
jgi:acyl-[acyl carrier protein]--UDP-N-acetylglucosamine O-acyltransferase